MATPAQRPNTWTLDQWYDQSVAGTTGGYIENFAMFTWGRNQYGQLGQETEFNPDRSSPVQVPGTTALWSNKTGACATNSNSSRMCAIKADGTAWGWGNNGYGQLGHNDAISSVPPVVSPRQVGTDTTWRSVVAGQFSSIWTKTDGTLWMCGSAAYGGLGQNQGGNASGAPRYSSPVQLGTGTDWSENVWTGEQGRAGGVKTDGTLWQWGYADNGTLGNNTNQGVYDAVSSPIQIPGTTWSTTLGNTAFTGQNFIMLKTDGTLWAWGYNDKGGLGLNNKISYSSPTQIPGTGWTQAIAFKNFSQAFKRT
jgi:alpha-tubulin suppressor-like RCC1 family protein